LAGVVFQVGVAPGVVSFSSSEPEVGVQAEAIVPDLVFIVSRTAPKRYLHLKYVYADEGRDVILDRRTGERRRSLRPPPVERRYVERRHRDITRELQSSGWALVRCPAT